MPSRSRSRGWRGRAPWPLPERSLRLPVERRGMASRPRSRAVGPATVLPAAITTPEALALHLEALHGLDPRFAAVSARAGAVPMRLIEPGFKGLAWVITGQQISTSACRAIFDRCEAALGSFSAECIAATEEALL